MAQASIVETLPTDDELEAQRYFHKRGLTDGLPIVVPTRARVGAFLEAAGFPPDARVATVAPKLGRATVELIAVSVVMAGCEPAHLQVVITAVQALTQEQFHLRGLQCTTNPVAPLALVNGPIRTELGIDSGRNALSLGSPAKYTFCLAENEEQSPWEPMHAALGFDAADSVVTVVGVEGIRDMSPCFKTADALLDDFGRALRAPGTNLWWSQGTQLVVLAPGHARILADAGMSRADVQGALFELSMIPLAQLPYGAIPQGDWTERDGKVLITERPEEIYIAVAGGPEPLHSVYMIGFGVSRAASQALAHPSDFR